MYAVCMNSDTTIDRLYEAWQHAVRRGMPDRYAKQKAYLVAKQGVQS